MVAFFKKNIYDYNLREKKLDEDIIRWGIFYIYVSSEIIWDLKQLLRKEHHVARWRMFIYIH